MKYFKFLLALMFVGVVAFNVHADSVKMENLPTATAPVAGDEFFFNDVSDSNVLKKVTLSNVFGSTANTGSSQIVTTGALNSGSVTSGFGSIDNGTSNVTTGGKLVIDVDGTAIDAVGAITFGASADDAIYHNGTNLEIDTATAIEFSISGTPEADLAADGFNVITGDSYQINNTSVLNATTLGSAVVTSSLTATGALASGSIAAGFGAIDNGTSNITTGGIVRVDVDGTGINAVGSIGFGAAATDSAIYWNGTNLEIDTTTSIELSIGGTLEADLAADGFNIITGDTYQVNNTSVLDATTLGTGVVNSSLTQTGALASGTIAAGFGAIDNGVSNITTGGIIKLDVNGTAENAAGSFTLGVANEAAIFCDGVNLIAITNGAGAYGIIFDSEDDTLEFKGSGVLQATLDLDGIDIITGNDYEINGASVLTATTLGGAVVTSSLTTVGALASGSIATGFGNIATGGTVTIGVDDTGADVKFFGASAGAFALYDESADTFDIRGASAAGPGKLKLTTGELTNVDGGILGRIDFQAPLDSAGTDAILVSASIWAEADDTFAVGVNDTDLVFATGKSETAVEEMRLDSDGNLGINTPDAVSLLDVRGDVGAAGIITASTAELTVVDGDVLGQINFQSPLESDGTDSIIVGASIYGEADATFSASLNTTDIVFATANSGAATEKMRIHAEGGYTVAAVQVTPNTASQAGSIIPIGATQVDVQAVSVNSDDWIVLPVIANLPIGHQIRIINNAGTNFELRTVAASNVKINTVDSDGTQEYLCVDTEIVVIIKVTDADGWVAYDIPAAGGIGGATTPD